MQLSSSRIKPYFQGSKPCIPVPVAGGGGGDLPPGDLLRDQMRRSGAGVLNRARARTLKMTVVMVCVFIFCWTPYYVISMWLVLFYSLVSTTSGGCHSALGDRLPSLFRHKLVLGGDRLVVVEINLTNVCHGFRLFFLGF